MEQNKMTPTPWISGGSFPYKGNEGYIFATSMRPEILVCRTFGDIGQNSPSIEEQFHNSMAIVSAINGTYGKGIDPSAVEDLLEAAKLALSWLENESEQDATILRAAIEKSAIK